MIRPERRVTISRPNTWQLRSVPVTLVVHDPLPVVIGHLERRHALGDAGGAQENVDVAERLEHRVSGRARARRRRSCPPAAAASGGRAASMASATSSTSAARRPTLTTSAPASARPSASARPMPLVPPTTTASAAAEIEQPHQEAARRRFTPRASGRGLPPAAPLRRCRLLRLVGAGLDQVRLHRLARRECVVAPGSPGRSCGASPPRREGRDRWRAPRCRAGFRSTAPTPSLPAMRRSDCRDAAATARWKLMSWTRNISGSSIEANMPATSSASVAI